MKIYQVDAFAEKVFGGNPAAVIILDQWPEDDWMQKVGNENNLAETAFIVPENNHFRIRWFTPSAEVDLCGHATLAAAFVMFTELGYDQEKIVFQSRSGPLTVTKNNDWLTLDFPVDHLSPIEVTPSIQRCSSANILEAYQGRSDFLFVLPDEDAVRESHFDQQAIITLGKRGVIVTAEGKNVDFVSRFFAPAFGIPEDPVTGSSHTTLTPYWAHRLGKTDLLARQISSRGGFLKCSLKGDRVLISGQAAIYMRGEIEGPPGSMDK